MADTTCGKCGKEPRSGKNRWGKLCLSEQRRRLRSEASAPGKPTKADRDAFTDSEVARLTGLIEAAGGEVVAGERDIAGLKRTLARTHSKPARAAAVTPVAEPEPPTRELTYGRASYAKPEPRKGLQRGQIVAHGGMCQCIACRSSR